MMKIFAHSSGAKVIFPFVFFRGFVAKTPEEKAVIDNADRICFATTAVLAVLFTSFYSAIDSIVFSYIFLFIFFVTIWVVRGIIAAHYIIDLNRAKAYRTYTMSLEEENLQHQPVRKSEFYFTLVTFTILLFWGLTSSQSGSLLKLFPILPLVLYILYRNLECIPGGAALKQRLDFWS